MSPTYTYAAFISYRHLPQDAQVAKQVQAAIETYKIPRGASVADGFQPGKPLGKCFRDEDELAAAHSLPEHITDALRQSSALVVVVSPQTQESTWVQREIEAYIEMHGRERIFVVLAAGDAQDCIPKILRTKTVLDVEGVEQLVPAEPLAADFRAQSAHKHADEKLRIIAAVAGCGFDDLRQRQRQRKRKRIGLGAMAAIALAGLIGGFAWNAHTSTQAALVEESKTLAAQAQRLYEQGDRYGAIEAALQALPKSSNDTSRPLVPEAQEALALALQVTPSDEQWLPCYSLPIDKVGRLIASENEGVVGFIPEDEIEFSLYDIETGRALDYVSEEVVIDFRDSHNIIRLRQEAIELAQTIVDVPGITDASTDGEKIIICSFDVPSEENLDKPYLWRLQAFDAGANMLWEYEDATIGDIALSLQVNGNLGYAGIPFIVSYGKNTQALIVIVRNKAIIIDAETGDKIAELSYPMPIVSARLFQPLANSEIALLYAACADGSVLWKNPFDAAFQGEGFSSKFQLPAYITQAIFVFCDDSALYLAAVADSGVSLATSESDEAASPGSAGQLLVYRYNTKTSESPSYSLDELLALAHETLEAAGREAPGR